MFVWVPPVWFRGPLLLVGCASCGGPVLLSARAWRGACRPPCLRCLGFVMSLSSFVSALPVVGAVSSASASPSGWLPVPPSAVCPLASGAGVPASVAVAGRLVPSSAFVPVALGVVSAVSAADPRGVVCLCKDELCF